MAGWFDPKAVCPEMAGSLPAGQALPAPGEPSASRSWWAQRPPLPVGPALPTLPVASGQWPVASGLR